jgi:serine/threonine protein phosphatase PrpC
MTADSLRLPSETLDTTLPPRPHSPQVMLRVAAHSDRGRVRENNEDRFIVVRNDRKVTTLHTNIDASQLAAVPFQTIWGLGVADGMGGHHGGEVASTLALNLTLQYSQQGLPWYVEIGDREVREIVKRFESILETVTREISSYAERDTSLAGMGTTLTVGVVRNDRLFIYHVGDSRAYLLRAGHLVRITRDQTVAQDMVDSGLADCLAGMQSARHLLTQAMGRGEVAVEVHVLNLEHGDTLLLSTDGLTDGVDDSEIEAVCRQADPDQACRTLIDRALAAGGRDNITVIVAQVEIAPAD